MSLPASSLTPFRCRTCQGSRHASADSKNLVVFIDGTSNKSGPKETNVKKLYDALPEDDVKQHKRYYEGIGAYDDHLPLLNRMGCSIKSGFDMAFARTVDENVTKAYLWLADRYREGDRLYLFGYSRGGYQVRALAGLIHEVGLLRKSEVSEERANQAYRRYISINPNNPKTKEDATKFKKDFCHRGVRVHLVGVWDTVSSLGLVKTAVHITASASVTNACHFRHALALDERRVKFMPEYFSEVNAHRSNTRSRRAVGVDDSAPDVNNTGEEKEVGDVKEVWFAGSHSDVGGISRPADKRIPNLPGDERHPAVHSGNVPFVWMRREATAYGLLTKPETSTWHPEDVDIGRRDTMKWIWRILEVIRIYHQISFSGTGKHAWRKHGYRPRSVIPAQHVHFSAFPGYVYVPRGTLAHRVDVPAVPPGPSEQWPSRLWTTELPDEESMITLLTSLLNDRDKVLGSLGEILFLLDLRLSKGQTQIIPKPNWLEGSVDNQSGFDKFALTVIHDVACTNDFSDSREQDVVARGALREILDKPDHPDFRRVLYIVRLLARHSGLCQRFIAHAEVIRALISALEKVPESGNNDSFPFVTECLRHVIDGGEQRNDVIDQLMAVVDGKKRVLLALEVKEPNHLVTSLEMIASLARYLNQSHRDAGLEIKIADLARQGRSPVGAAAVAALVAFNVSVPHDVHISSIISYLGQILPRLDAEIDDAPLPQNINLPRVLQVNGSGGVNDDLIKKLLSTTSSLNAHLRTAATLTLLKLCHVSAIREMYSRPMLGIFMSQLERRKTSLLAAYALMVCLKYNMWTDDDSPRVALLIVSMMDKGWFDDAVGRVEGSKIFGEFMASERVGPKVLEQGIINTLQKQLEGRDYHKARMSLIYLEGYWRTNQAQLTRALEDSLIQLKDVNRDVQKKGVRILSALARTKVGEEAIVPHIAEIVSMLLPPSGSPFQLRPQLFGPIAAVYNLCKNETLWKHIRDSPEYADFKRLPK